MGEESERVAVAVERVERLLRLCVVSKSFSRRPRGPHRSDTCIDHSPNKNRSRSRCRFRSGCSRRVSHKLRVPYPVQFPASIHSQLPECQDILCSFWPSLLRLYSPAQIDMSTTRPFNTHPSTLGQHRNYLINCKKSCDTHILS